MLCVECGGNMEESREALEYCVRNEAFIISDIPHFICDSCGEVEIDLASAEILSDRAHALYREKHGLLNPDEIRAVRKSFGVTQREFETIINSGKTTVSRWESGAVMQPAVVDTLLRALRSHPDVFYDLAKISKAEAVEQVENLVNA